MSEDPDRRPVFVLHRHERPRLHYDLRLEEGGMLRSWAVPKGLPAISSQDRLAIAVEDHDLDHATYTDEHKSIADHGWWQVIDRDDRRIVLDLHGTTGTSRYALVHTGRAAGRDESRWLLHRVRA